MQEVDGSYLLRLGYQDRANFLPLLYPLKAGWALPESPWKLEIANDTPQSLLEGLLGGDLDAAFISPVALTQHSRQIAPLRGWGLAVEGATETGMILAPQRLDLVDGRSITVFEEAQGSTAAYLMRTLLTPYYGISLTIRAAGDAEETAEDARLLYGDSAALEGAKQPEGAVAEDLGKAWFILSGLPMVWEMLAAPRDLDGRKPGASEALHALIARSQRAAQEQQSTILDEAATRLGLKKETVKGLFARQKYTLGEKEQKGLAYFLDQAARAGVLPR
ncbi:MAG TPA: MqnA/MqnD/SBP family protein [Chloroflexia bacterium]|jgi:predicted solute-binding protein